MIIRCLVLIPGLFWLLLPPVCICELPTRVLDTIAHGTPLFPVPGDTKDSEDAPWCPVLKKYYPTTTPQVVELPDCLDCLAFIPLPAAVSPRALHDPSLVHAEADTAPPGQLTYLLVRALRI